ncbi:hypothetical protein GE061_019754 [Apolygus lucorum]|uniref:Uncharacterized protein n=1 Tax=Apolygus lucorum TaxID=248454 RepID=A0A8S9XBA2_APOLU|nr:hypothetical protein GE061_019754 [Apolygus lucorum]
MTTHFKVKNEFALSGENLEYYQDIQYLKELTKQATALMSRSNAVYNNILNELEIGHSVGGLNSPSFTDLGKLPDDGRCNLCGLSHGADYCILQQILTGEETEKSQEKLSGKRSRDLSKSTFQVSARLGRESRSSVSYADTFSYSDGQVFSTGKKSTHDKFPIFENLSPKELLDTYEVISKRFGDSNGMRFLLAYDLAHKKDEKIEPWTVPCDARPEKVVESPPSISYEKIKKDCFPEVIPFDPLCPDYSSKVRQKVETLVKLTPPCDAEPLDKPKNWKGILTRRREVKKEVPRKKDDSSELTLARAENVQCSTCECELEDCDCEGDVTCMKSPKYVCPQDENLGVNYLLTVRNRIERRRRCWESVRSTMATSRDTQTQDVTHQKQSNFLEKAFEEQEHYLNNCLTKRMVKLSSHDSHEFNKNIRNVVEMAAPTKVVDEHALRNWMVSYDKKESETMNSDRDSDSGDSRINSEYSGITEHSEESDLDYRESRKVIPTRIPFAEECYKLTDILFDKINSHFEKSIQKNGTVRRDTAWQRPTFSHVMQKIKMLETTNRIFHEVLLNMRYFRFYPKWMKPFHVTKQSKIRRLESLVRKSKKVDRKRKWNQGIQIGKPYRRYDKDFKFRRGGNFEGFSEHKREYLQKPESRRIKSYNLVGDVTGRVIDKKRIHNDFRLIRNLFDDDSSTRRRVESMMDEGMRKRLEQFKRRGRGLSETLPEPPATMSNEEAYTASDVDLDFTTGMKEHNFPKKEEMTMEQAAPVKCQFDQNGRKEESFSSATRKSLGNLTNMKGCKAESEGALDEEIDDGKYEKHNADTLSGNKEESSSARIVSTLRSYAMKSQNVVSGSCKRSSAYSIASQDGDDASRPKDIIVKQPASDKKQNILRHNSFSTSPRQSGNLSNMKESTPRGVFKRVDSAVHDESNCAKDGRKPVDTSFEKLKKTSSKHTFQSARILSKLHTYAIKSQDNLPGSFKTSSIHSETKSSRNEHTMKQSNSNTSVSLGSKRTQSVPHEGNIRRALLETDKNLASLESMPPIKTLFDERFRAVEPKSRPASCVSSASKQRKLAGLS